MGERDCCESSSPSPLWYGFSENLVLLENPSGSEVTITDDLVGLTEDKKYFVTLATHQETLQAQIPSFPRRKRSQFPPRPVSEPLPFIFSSDTEAWVVSGNFSGNFFARRFRSTKGGRLPELVEIGNFSSDGNSAELHGEGVRLMSGSFYVGNFEHGNFFGNISDHPKRRSALVFPDPRINFRSEEISIDPEEFAHGAYGKVFRGNFKKFPITPTSSASTSPGNLNGNFLAIKKFDNPEDLGKEISVLGFLKKSPNLVRLQGVVLEPGNFWLITSLVS